MSGKNQFVRSISNGGCISENADGIPIQKMIEHDTETPIATPRCTVQEQTRSHSAYRGTEPEFDALLMERNSYRSHGNSCRRRP
jgi:hypothetical protein